LEVDIKLLRIRRLVYTKRYFLKLSLIYFIISVSLVLLFSIVFDDIYTSLSRNFIREEERVRSIQIAKRIESMMNEYLHLAYDFAASEEVKTFFGEPRESKHGIFTSEVLQQYLLYKKGAEELHFISRSAENNISTGYIPNLYLYKNWGILYNLSTSLNDHLFFSSIYRGLSGDTICLSVAVKVFNTVHQVIGYIIIDVYRNKLQSLIEQGKSVQSSINITNKKNFIIYSGVRYDEGKKYIPVDQNDFTYSFSHSILENSFILNYEVQNSFLLEVKEKFREKISWLVIVSIIISMITALIISSGLRKPINKLITTMKIVGEGNLEAQIDLKKRDDLHELQDEFNKFVRQLKRLQDENMENERLLHQAQIAFLQAQIKPHFLYNMLATIKGMVSYSSPEEVKTAIITLSRLLRNSFDFSEELRPLKDHLEIIQCYVDMQNFRFPNKFQLLINADQKSLSCRMPPLLLQPIVENSIIHGFSDKEEACTIDIQTEMHDGYLFITIKDNGTGIPNRLLREIKRDKTNAAYPHIGLTNVIKRIKFFYDDSCFVDIESHIGKGTTVTFKLYAL